MQWLNLGWEKIRQAEWRAWECGTGREVSRWQKGSTSRTPLAEGEGGRSLEDSARLAGR